MGGPVEPSNEHSLASDPSQASVSVVDEADAELDMFRSNALRLVMSLHLSEFSRILSERLAGRAKDSAMRLEFSSCRRHCSERGNERP